MKWDNMLVDVAVDRLYAGKSVTIGKKCYAFRGYDLWEICDGDDEWGRCAVDQKAWNEGIRNCENIIGKGWQFETEHSSYKELSDVLDMRKRIDIKDFLLKEAK